MDSYEAMGRYMTIGRYLSIFMLLTQLVLIGLQVAAYRRHRHASFLVLSLSSIVGLVYSVVVSLPYLTASALPHVTSLITAGAVIFVPAALLGITGTALLFAAYRQLADTNAHALARLAVLEAHQAGPPLPVTRPRSSSDR
jgi:biotin transporter BioY